MKKLSELKSTSSEEYKPCLGTSDNPLKDQDSYKTVKDITDACNDIHYVSNYKDSNKIKEILADKKFIEPLDSKQNQNYDGGTLYSNGALVYFFWFHQM